MRLPVESIESQKLPVVPAFTEAVLCSQAADEVCAEHPEDHQGHENGCCIQDACGTSLYREVQGHYSSPGDPARGPSRSAKPDTDQALDVCMKGIQVCGCPVLCDIHAADIRLSIQHLVPKPLGNLVQLLMWREMWLLQSRTDKGLCGGINTTIAKVTRGTLMATGSGPHFSSHCTCFTAICTP